MSIVGISSIIQVDKDKMIIFINFVDTPYGGWYGVR